MALSSIALCSVSWIDQKPLPKVGFWLVAGAAFSWPNRVIMGLAGTANPEPPGELLTVDGFRAQRQYRALLSCKLRSGPPPHLTDQIIDAGYTPPFDKAKLDTQLAHLAPIADDRQFYAGEASNVSSIVLGRLHPCSTLSVGSADKVLVSAFIKFRAGPHTDQIGINDAKSPVHVPWVWCEYALVSSGAKTKLLAQGSSFPSHAWYVAGRQVARRYQCQVSASESDPAISTGLSAKLPAASATSDCSSGPANGHEHAIDKGTAIDVDLTALIS